MKVIRVFGRSIRDAFKSFIRNFGLSMASILCTTITLILVAVAIISAANIDNSTKLIENELSIVAYFSNEVSKETIVNVKTEIEVIDEVLEVKFKSKDEWKLEMMEYDKTMETVLNYLPENPLYDSLTIKVKDVKDLTKTAEYIKTIKGINSVKYGEGMIEMVVITFDIIEKIVIGVVIALILVTAFLISNTIKLTIFSRKHEIEIMRLVGASNIAIKLPFLIEGLIIGVVGSIIPICISIYGYVILYSKMNGYIFSNMLVMIEPYNFVFYVSLILLVIGALVGMYGSVKAVRKHLKI